VKRSRVFLSSEKKLSFSFEQRKVVVVELKKWAYMCEICAKRREKDSIVLLAVLYTACGVVDSE
jgi:U3 small nucleolar ribonucleoprotein component